MRRVACGDRPGARLCLVRSGPRLGVATLFAPPQTLDWSPGPVHPLLPSSAGGRHQQPPPPTPAATATTTRAVEGVVSGVTIAAGKHRLVLARIQPVFRTCPSPYFHSTNSTSRAGGDWGLGGGGVGARDRAEGRSPSGDASHCDARPGARLRLQAQPPSDFAPARQSPLARPPPANHRSRAPVCAKAPALAASRFARANTAPH